MDNEVPLPPPRRIRHRSPARATASGSPSTSLASSFRKAGRLSRFDDRSSQPSSDPALFSSDDIPASGLENYNAPAMGAGRKRRYRGTWWGEQMIDPKRKRADFKEKRNFDSGVWMGSDESGVESLLPSEDGPWGEDLLKTVLDPKTSGKSAQGPLLLLPSEKATSSILPLPILKGPNESEEHRFARSVVNDCLEKGEDVVDLGYDSSFQLNFRKKSPFLCLNIDKVSRNINLMNIPSGLLRPLQHLTKLPSVEVAPISENIYSSLQPFLSIYLPGNSLSQLHHELFELSGLKVLSVRNNELLEIPYAIQKLTALEVLNVSVNRLTYLPWELLHVIKIGELKHLTVYPNPFPSIEEAAVAKWHREPEKKTQDRPYDEYESEKDEPTPILETPRFDRYEGSPPPSAWAAIHVATGLTTRLDTEGRPIATPASRMILPSSERISATPSLREVALRAVCKLPDLEHVTDEELAEFPTMVIPLMQRVKKIRAAGGQQCSVCHKEYIIPRAEWLEWWDCTPQENGLKRARASGEKLRPLPFKRYGCSWICVP
ncbi:hypothetical protein N7454_005710 [Penicillium verhagenii]|nr:hypothetical protein N7454_005710 [Penicillium verhagenii]